MTSDPTCPECGERLPADAPRGLCPACLLKVGLAGDTSEALDLTRVNSSSFGEGLGPDPDELSTSLRLSPDVTATAAVRPPLGTIRYFGDYELHGELGRGAMGVVYRARQVSLNRPVALKLIRAGALAGAEELWRFQNEAEAVAQLDHPGIVPVYEVGEHDGQRYFSMKLVPGGNLAQRLAVYRDDPRAAAALLAEAAEAVHHAHQRGILHRDLKPANILVDDDGHPHVSDFGLARRVEADAEMTASGTILGTPAYMAREQAMGKRGAITTATDVYGLGAIFYALLTGRAPFRGDSLADTLTQVKEQPPEPPRKLNARVPRDLEIVCLKCLEKDPWRRYKSAQALADDLRAWLESRPIAARSVGTLERLVKWSRREPTLAALIAVSILGVAAVLVTLMVSHARVTRSLQREHRLSYFQSIALAEQAWSGNDVGRAEHLLDVGPPEFRNWEWRYLKRLCHADLLTIRGHDGLAPMAVAFSPDGATLATSGPYRNISLHESRTGRTIRTLGGHGGGVYDVAFSPDGSRLASAGVDGIVRVWDFASKREPLAFSLPDAAAVLDVVFSPDGSRLASASGDFREGERGGREGGGAMIWDAATGYKVHTLSGHAGTVYRVAFSPDGARLASAGRDGTIRLWDVASGAELRRLGGHSDAVRGLSFSPDGSRLASAGQDGRIRIMNLDGGAPDRELREPDDRFFDVAFSPDGARLATAGRNWTVTLWDAATGDKLTTYRGHTREVVGLSFSPDGSRLASAGYEGVVKVWDTNRDQGALVLRGRAGPGTAVAFSPDNRRVAMTADEPGGGLHLWDAATGRPVPAPVGAEDAFASVAFGPDGTSLAAGRARTGEVTLWDPATGRAVRTWKAHAVAVTAVSYSPDGRRLATGGKDRIVAVWDLASGLRLFSAGPFERAITGLAYSPDGRHLAVSTGDRPPIEAPGEVALLDAETGRRARTLTGHKGGVSDLAYSRDGRHLATASWDRTVAVWDPSTGERVHSFAIRGLIVWAVAFSPDGRRLVAADNIGRMQFWDVESGLDVVTLRGHMDRIYDLAFSPDGFQLVTASRDGTARVWDSRPHSPVRANGGNRWEGRPSGESGDSLRLGSHRWGSRSVEDVSKVRIGPRPEQWGSFEGGSRPQGCDRPNQHTIKQVTPARFFSPVNLTATGSGEISSSGLSPTGNMIYFEAPGSVGQD